MKRVFFSFLSALMLFAVQQVDAVKYVDAQSLTFLGKMCETTNPYHRVEVDDYPSLNNTEKTLLRDASGLAVVFETNSSSVWVKAQVGVHRTSTGMPRAAACILMSMASGFGLRRKPMQQVKMPMAPRRWMLRCS